MTQFFTLHLTRGDKIYVSAEQISSIEPVTQLKPGDVFAMYFEVYLTSTDSNGDRIKYKADDIENCDYINGISLKEPAEQKIIPVSAGHIVHFYYVSPQSREFPVEGYTSSPMLAWLVRTDAPERPTPVTAPIKPLGEGAYFLVEYPDKRFINSVGDEYTSVGEWVDTIKARRGVSDTSHHNFGDDIPTEKPMRLRAQPKVNDAVALQSLIKSQSDDGVFKPR